MKLKIYQHTHVTYSKWCRVEFKAKFFHKLKSIFFFKNSNFKLFNILIQVHVYLTSCVGKVPPLSSGITSGPVQSFKNCYCRLTNPVLHLACTLFLQDKLSQSLEVVNISTLDKPLHNSLLQIQSSC